MLNNESYGLLPSFPAGEEEAEYFIEILEQSVDMKREMGLRREQNQTRLRGSREAYQEAGAGPALSPGQ